MSPSCLFTFLVALIALIEYSAGLMCHRCNSAMGGCLHELDLWMFPWKSCGESDFCVKYIEKVRSEYKIIRECESVLMKQTRHRLQMPVLRRHGYCLPARKHDPWKPGETTDSSIKYCFCNDFNGCNHGTRLSPAMTSLGVLSVAALISCVWTTCV